MGGWAAAAGSCPDLLPSILQLWRAASRPRCDGAAPMCPPVPMHLACHVRLHGPQARSARCAGRAVWAPQWEDSHHWQLDVARRLAAATQLQGGDGARINASGAC